MRIFLVIFAVLSFVYGPAQVDSLAPKGLYLGMDIREFAQVYPHLAPRSIAFTGHLKRDSVWCGTPWSMDFSFGRDHLSGATFLSPPLADDQIKEVRQQVVAELRPLYGPPAELPFPDSVNRLPVLYWQLKTQQLRLSTIAGGVLHFELTSLTRPVPGQITLDYPFFIGMPLGTFAVFHPQFIPRQLGYNGVIERPDRFGEIEGIWQYWFRQGKMKDMFFRRTWVLMPEDDPENWGYVQAYSDTLIQRMGQSLGAPRLQQGQDSLVTVEGIHRQAYANWVLSDSTTQLEVLFGQHDGTKGIGYFFKLDYSPVAE